MTQEHFFAGEVKEEDGTLYYFVFSGDMGDHHYAWIEKNCEARNYIIQRSNYSGSIIFSKQEDYLAFRLVFGEEFHEGKLFW